MNSQDEDGPDVGKLLLALIALALILATMAVLDNPGILTKVECFFTPGLARVCSRI